MVAVLCLQASPMPAPVPSNAPGSRVQVYITLVPRADVGAAASIGAAFQEAVSSGMMANSLSVAGVPHVSAETLDICL